MATYTSNYGWTKPSGSDNVDISVLNDNLDDQDSTIHDAFLNMAPPFSESSTYAVDDIVLYTTGLYKCHTAVVTPGSWTGSTNWQVYKLSEGGSGGGGTSNYNDLTNKPSINGVTLSGNKTTSDLGINATNVMMSDGVTSVEDALDGHVSVTNSGSETTSSMLNRLWALVDLSKVTPRSVLLFNGVVSTYIYTKTSAALLYNVSTYNATTKIKSILNFVVTSSDSVAVQTSTPASGTTSENNFSSRTTDSGFTLYY